MRYFTPPKGGGRYGPQGPWKRGSEGPQTPQNGHFGVILTLLGSKNPQPLVFGLKWPPKTPPKVIFYHFFKKKTGTPPGNRKNRKKGLVFGLKFSKTFEKLWKNPPIFRNPGGFGANGPPKAPKGPQRASNDRFRLSIPSTTSFLWP